MIQKLTDCFAQWLVLHGGGAAGVAWAAYASLVGLFISGSMIFYLVFLRLRAGYALRQRRRVESVWHPVLIQALTVPEEPQEGIDLPALPGRDRDAFIQLMIHFSVRIPPAERRRLKKLCDRLGLTPIFLNDLKSGNAWIRARSALHCGYAGISDAVPALLGLLKDRDPLVVYDAARAIGMLGDAGAVREVVTVICRQDGWSREKIIELLLEFGPKVAMETLRQFLSGNVASNWMLPMIEIMGHFRVVEARPALEAVARGEDEGINFAAIKALGRIGSPSSDWVLRACLTSGSPRIRRAAAGALGMCMAVKAEQELVDMLGDADIAVRQAAAETLVAFGDRGMRRLWEVSARPTPETSPLGAPEALTRPGKIREARDTAAWALQRASWSRAVLATRT